MDVRDRSNYTSSVESSSVEASSRPRTEKQSATISSAATSRGQDSSDLSSAARVASQAAQIPEVRQDRVSALQQRIASGTYNVQPQDVADAMLRTLRG